MAAWQPVSILGIDMCYSTSVYNSKYLHVRPARRGMTAWCRVLEAPVAQLDCLPCRLELPGQLGHAEPKKTSGTRLNIISCKQESMALLVPGSMTFASSRPFMASEKLSDLSMKGETQPRLAKPQLRTLMNVKVTCATPIALGFHA